MVREASSTDSAVKFGLQPIRHNRMYGVLGWTCLLVRKHCTYNMTTNTKPDFNILSGSSVNKYPLSTSSIATPQQSKVNQRA